MTIALAATAAEPLLARIADRSAVVAVVGLGYVGLTVAAKSAGSGYRVIGIDIDPLKVAAINRGISPIGGEEPGLADLIGEQVAAGRLVATGDHARLASADLVIVVVQTPIDGDTKQPDLRALVAALTAIGPHLRPGALLIVESTIPPGTMASVVVPTIERSADRPASAFLIGCCPERVMPGKLLANLDHCDRVMGGWTAEAAQVGAAFYETITSGAIDQSDCLTAEITKTAENAYRDVQIAFANELALICEDLGADVYTVRTLINKSPGRDVLLPGAGVGGHCIPKDPWLLIGNIGDSTTARLIPCARDINDGMPQHVGSLVQAVLAEAGQRLKDSRIVVLGAAYLENSDDARNAPTVPLAAWLESQGATVLIHDPYVAGYQIDLAAAATGADALVLMVAHDAYRDLALGDLRGSMRSAGLVDGRHFFDADTARAAGFTYRCVGIG